MTAEEKANQYPTLAHLIAELKEMKEVFQIVLRKEQILWWQQGYKYRQQEERPQH